jgi:dimethylargininase
MFTSAITLKPGSRFSEGITTAHLGKPDLSLALQQHSGYVRALRGCGLTMIELEEDDRFPDSCFVEDTAVITDEIAVITNPGAISRKGEIESMITVLEKFRTLEFIRPPGTLEGGDVMQVDKDFYIGLTDRTNLDGASQLERILSGYGYSCCMIPVTDALHLKSSVNYIGNNNLLVTKEFFSHPALEKFNRIEVSDAEQYASNCLLVNGKLIVPGGFNKIQSQLQKLNYDIIELSMSEFEKMDGGLSCLSLRFH